MVGDPARDQLTAAVDLAALASYYDPAATTDPAGASARPPAPARRRVIDWARPPGLPSRPALEYTKDAVTALVLVLALPWLVKKLLTNPGEVIEGAGRKQVKP